METVNVMIAGEIRTICSEDASKATRVGPIDEDGREMWSCEEDHIWINES
jgi:hypothetical protein